MSGSVVMAMDAGTTGIRAILFDKAGEVVAEASQEFRQIYPQSGWVEHDPVDIWNTQLTVAHKVLDVAGLAADQVAAIGITNQRETTVVWDRHTGHPVYNAIVWQDRRTAGRCDELKAWGLTDHVRRTTGLVIDAYFSGTKIDWILRNVPGARERAAAGDLLFGTVDSWLIWNLTGGAGSSAAVHVTDYSNASRTMLFDINRLDWDPTMLAELDIPRSMLPQVRPTSEIFGHTDASVFFGVPVPVAAAVGDQHAALFGQACFEPGMIKSTYGTGASLLMNTGERPVFSDKGLLTTVAWGVDGQVQYALEGLIFVSAASIQWLRDELKIIYDSADTEYAALRVPDSGGVYFVPAFVGLAAPHWDPYARGGILGLSFGVNRNHVIRAALEAIAYQIRDLTDAMQTDSGIPLVEVKVDGGASKNNFLMQFQADLLGVPALRPVVTESSARGAAFLAGLAVGFWADRAELVDSFRLDRRFEPAMKADEADRLHAGWLRAVERVRDWEEH